MKILKLGLRLWITLASMSSFVVGWVMLAHAPKPNQNNSISDSGRSAAAIPTLAPLPPLDSGSTVTTQNQPLFNDPSVFNQPQPSFRPKKFFSTGGS